MIALAVGILSALIALASAIASIVSARAANRSAKSSEASVRQAAIQQRTSIERDANRNVHQIFAGTSRVVELSGQLQRSYTTLFALNGRNVDAAKPLVEQVVTKRAEAEAMQESASDFNEQNLKSLTDTQLLLST